MNEVLDTFLVFAVISLCITSFVLIHENERLKEERNIFKGKIEVCNRIISNISVNQNMSYLGKKLSDYNYIGKANSTELIYKFNTSEGIKYLDVIEPPYIENN